MNRDKKKVPYSINDTVAVCYDGKWSRAVEGKIVGMGPRMPPTRLTIRFKPWANEEVGFVTINVRRKPTANCYGGYLKGSGENGIMRMLGFNGDWYSVYKTQELNSHDYSVEPYDRQATVETGSNKAIIGALRDYVS